MNIIHNYDFNIIANCITHNVIRDVALMTNVCFYLSDDWVGIIRSCYEMGSLSVNETNGCHVMKIAGLTTTAKLCFCDTDYCNHAMVTWSPVSGLAVVTSLVVSVLYHFVHPY